MNGNTAGMLIAKKRIEMLAGVSVHMRVNEGRNRIVDYDATIDKMYDGIFTVRREEDGKIFSYPYSDLITKNVKFLKREDRQ